MTQLTAGAKAPDFNLLNQDNQNVKLSDFKGYWLILYFYPRDNTPGCSLEARDFTCLQQDFEKLGIKIIGISKDSVSSHQRFIEKQALNLTLLSDQDLKVMQAYGVWREKTLYGKTALGVVRSTFLIDPQGTIHEAWYNVKAKDHAQKMLEYCKELRTPLE
ncbi:MAG: thioredoxin-dependent thiol peroxidase [Candidatus Cloacimonetes bacterium]|nr:thioredoxin-dependent thiol peroxidase [Candidatus Cloacimonadota bacterium]